LRQFLWPGFGDNSRVLEWIVNRLENKSNFVETPIGFVPRQDAINTTNLDVSPATLQELLKVDKAKWLKEADNIEAYHSQFGSHLPKGIKDELNGLRARLNASA